MVRVIDASIDPAHRDDIVDNVTRNLQAWARDPQAGVHLVAEDGSGLVGVVLVKAFWNLCSLFVAPEQQRHGIGRQLVHAALQACRGRSPKQAIHLNAAPNAVPFYSSLGFTARESSQPLPAGFRALQLTLAPTMPRPSSPSTPHVP